MRGTQCRSWLRYIKASMGRSIIMVVSGRAEIIMRTFFLGLLAVLSLGLGACENMTPGQKGAVTGGAIGTGIGLVSGGTFGQVVGAGLIGGGVGYIVGETTK